MIDWFEMNDSVWIASRLFGTVSLWIHKVSDKSYTLGIESLDGKKTIKSDIESFEMAKQEAEIYLFRRKER